MSDTGRIEIRIKQVAEQEGVHTASELARRTGLSRETTRHLLAAKSKDDLHRIGIETIEKLCFGLRTSPAQLLLYHPLGGWDPSGVHDDAAGPN